MERRGRESLIFVSLLCLMVTLTESATVTIPVGVILDLNSSLGSITLNCTNLGLLDFYSTHDSYATRLQLHFWHSGNDLLTAAIAAWNLINGKKVHAILGPQNSEQARYVVELGKTNDVPVIWFSPSGPSLLPPRTRFFIHSNSTRSHCSQFEAIAAIIEAYDWQSVIPIYEDPEFGNDLIPCLSYALQDMDTRMPYISVINQTSTDSQIAGELNKIKAQRTFVFVVHMSLELWSIFAEHAKNADMMSEGYAWILTQGLSSVMDPEALDVRMKGYMDGALGVRPFVLSNLTKRLSLVRKLKSEYDKTLSLNGLWAYDTITALARAVEKAGLVSFNESGADLRNETGPELRGAILDTDFVGLSGNFNLRQEQLEQSHVVVYNVQGQKERTIGNWSPEKGLVRMQSVRGEPIWPGNTKEIPPKLKVGVPKTHFTEFVDVNGSVEGQHVSVAGFAVDVFEQVVGLLPLPLRYEFVPLNNSGGELTPFSYDDLLCQFADKKVDVDVIIGDITIVVSRTNCVDFTMPYLDSSVSMVVKVRSDSKSMWILFRPFDWLLWFILVMILVAATVFVIILEKQKEKKTEDDVTGSKSEIKTKDDVRGSKSANKTEENVEGSKSKENTEDDVTESKAENKTEDDVRGSKSENKTEDDAGGSKSQDFVRNPFLIYMSDRTNPKPPPWKDVQEIRRSNRKVGYQTDSWMRVFLTHQLGLKDDQLRNFTSREEYMDALSNEDKENGGVDAIFDETPYLRLFLSQCPSCQMAGPIYKAGGFAFAFPKNSTLVSNFSTAILEVTQNVTMFRQMREKISFPITVDRSEYKSSIETRSLKIGDFGGLFPIILFVLVLFFCLSIRNKLVSCWHNLWRRE
ncbi:glutamate receptor 2.9 isoform X2 [Neltuma alba]|uniref:glutamate receptor 2.9 isoform X2 n=1 Tax=Neltuma alba TaxID=207710 RepID=UPI0010A4AB06|nr:glutamate receptor 2.9-like isoform X2 [Prosopis alba]